MPIHEYAVKLAAPVRWILILGIVATVLNTARNLLYLPEAPITNATQGSAPTKATSPSKAVDINALVNLHLFGKPAREQRVVPQSVANAQATRLPLELKAVFAASENTLSAAIIGQKGQRARLYTVGESVPGNAVLAEVYSQQVLLRRAGKLESLAFPASTYKARSKSPATAFAANTPVTNGKKQTNGEPSAEPVVDRDLLAPTKVTNELASATQQLMADPGAAIEQLGLTAQSGGGYKVGGVANSPYLQTAGLKAGDIIFSINGTPMSNVNNNKTLLTELMASGRARIEVMRNNQRFVITASLPTTR
jgi:general secretion pathway protein C